MNLHDIRTSLTNAYIWVTLHGANGHHMGTHLLQFEEGTPPPITVETKPPWMAGYRWSPERFRWKAFKESIDAYRYQAWRVPLCGKRSTSRSVRLYTSSRGCAECQQVANQRGMLALSIDEANLLSDAGQALAAERQAFEEAGRPDTWPVQT
jgi:hypothetical protein